MGKNFCLPHFWHQRERPSPYNNFSNPLVELPLSASEIIAVDAVIVTHMHHFDHFDDHAAKALPKTMPMMPGLGWRLVQVHYSGPATTAGGKGF